MIYPTFAAAMAQRMGLPSGRGSHEVFVCSPDNKSKFAGIPGVQMNLPGLQWPARGSLAQHDGSARQRVSAATVQTPG